MILGVHLSLSNEQQMLGRKEFDRAETLACTVTSRSVYAMVNVRAIVKGP